MGGGLHLAEQGQLDVDPCSQTCAQVGGTCKDIAKSLVPHELPALLLDQTLHLKHITPQDISAFSTFLTSLSNLKFSYEAIGCNQIIFNLIIFDLTAAGASQHLSSFRSPSDTEHTHHGGGCGFITAATEY